MTGLKRREGGGVDLPLFDAARPVHTGRLVALKTAALMGAVVVGWAAVLLSAAVWLSFTADLSEINKFIQQAWVLLGIDWAFVLVAAAVYGFVAISTPLAAAWWLPHHTRFMAIGYFVGIAYLVLFVWDMSHGSRLVVFWRVNGWMMAAALIGGTVFALHKGIRKGLVSVRVLCIALGVWGYFILGIAGILGKLRPLIPPIDIPACVYALVAAGLIIPLAAVALPSLALDAHRHQ